MPGAQVFKDVQICDDWIMIMVALNEPGIEIMSVGTDSRIEEQYYHKANNPKRDYKPIAFVIVDGQKGPEVVCITNVTEVKVLYFETPLPKEIRLRKWINKKNKKKHDGIGESI